MWRGESRGSEILWEMRRTLTAIVTSALKIGIIVITIFIPLVGIIMGLIYMKDADPRLGCQ